MPVFENGRSAVASAPLVVKRRRGGLAAAAVGALVLAGILLALGVQATRADRSSVAALCATGTGAAVLLAIVLGILASRAGTPLLVVDDAGVATGRPPKLRFAWADLDRVRVYPHPSGGGAIGIVPTSVEEVATRVFGAGANAEKYAARLSATTAAQGAPIVVRLAGTSTEPAAAMAAIHAFAAGRADVTG